MPILGTVRSSSIILPNSFYGPFRTSNGTLVAFAVSTTNTDMVYRILSTNDGVTWSSGWGENIFGAGSVHSMWVTQNGDSFDVLIQTSDGSVGLAPGITATSVASFKIVQGATTTAAPRGACCLVRRSTGELVAVFQGPQYTSMGKSYATIYYSRSTDNGGTWTTPTQLAGTSETGTGYLGCVAGARGDDVIRCHGKIGSAGFFVTLSDTNVVSMPTTVSIAVSASASSPASSVVGRSTDLFGYLTNDTGGSQYISYTGTTSGIGGLAGLDATLSKLVDGGYTDFFTWRSATDVFYRVLAASDGAVYFYSGTFKSFTSFKTAIAGTYQRAHCNVYTKSNGDVVLGFIAYNDVNALHYGEELIQAGGRKRQWIGAAAQREWLGASANGGVKTGKAMV